MLKGKNALVTGGSRGIGRALALALAREGANVAIAYAGNEAAAAETVGLLEETGVKALSFRCDVADFEAAGRLIQEVINRLGSLDILINNAGITRDGLALSMKEADFDAVVATNLKGCFNTIRHAYRPMMRQRSGRIINISSVVGLMGNAGQANYAAAKAGVIGLTKSVAKELAGRGVTCNAIAPGLIDTDMTQAMPGRAREAVLEAIPAGRAGRPEEVAALAVFLAGEQAGYITGETIRIDGGMYI